MFADTFSSKFVLPVAEVNEYTALEECTEPTERWRRPTEEEAVKELEKLDGESATGPDLVPTRALKECAKVLAWPLLLLAKKVVATARWPET